MAMLKKVRDSIVASSDVATWETITKDFTDELLAFSLGAPITVFTDNLEATKDIYGLTTASVNAVAAITDPTIESLITEQFNGEFLLDPNEINSATIQGTYDNRQNGDLGNVGAANLTRTTAGYVYPYDVKLVGFTAHLNNSEAGNNAWGFVFYAIERNAASDTVSTTFLRDESFDRGDGFFGLRDYANSTNQSVFLGATDFVDTVIPAGQIIFAGFGAPTADTTDNYVRVSAGCFVFERV